MPKYKKINKSICHCITLRRASNVITEYYDKAFNELGISVNQYSLLINLYRLELASTSELAEQVNLDRSTLVRNLKPLLEKGYIVDIAEPRARNHQFKISDRGKKLLEEALPIWEKTQADIEQYLGDGNIELLMNLLYRIQELQNLN